MTIDQPDLDDLREVLDASFGDGPAMPAPADRLAAGRRALRRRRLAGVRRVRGCRGRRGRRVVRGARRERDRAAGRRPGGARLPAPRRRPRAACEAERQAELDRLAQEAQQHAERIRKAQLVSNQFPAALDNDGSLVVKDGWEVTQQVPEPVGYEAPEASLGVVVTDGERIRWMLLTARTREGQACRPAPAPTTRARATAGSRTGWPAWSRSAAGPSRTPWSTVGADDQVVAGPGSTLVDVQEIDVVEGYTSPGDRVAEVRRDGRTWFVVIRGHGSDAEIIPVDADVLPESTLAALLTYLAQQAESGEGVR